MVGITGTTGAIAGTYVADITDGEDQAHRSGFMSACFGVGMVAGPVVGGLLGTAFFCLARFGDDGEDL